MKTILVLFHIGIANQLPDCKKIRHNRPNDIHEQEQLL